MLSVFTNFGRVLENRFEEGFLGVKKYLQTEELTNLSKNF